MTRIASERIAPLNDRAVKPRDYVLYWMQQSQRPAWNDALDFAAERANKLRQPLLVAFGLTDDYPDANARHYRFMLQGLRETQAALETRGIRMVVQRGSPERVALDLARHASLVVCDRGYLRHQRQWRDAVADGAGVQVVEVEADAVVPVEVASDKLESAARTLRPKIERQLDRFLVKPRAVSLRKDSLHLQPPGIDLGDVDAALASLKIDRTVPPSPLFTGGPLQAEKLLRRFITRKLPRYDAHRNQPQTDDVSYMSMYLHFGQISPVRVALAVRGAEAGDNSAAFLEELIVRRELAFNFVWHCPQYDTFDCLPAWAKATLQQHQRDKRPHRYSPAQLDAAATHDPYWNAAMNEMKHTGYMHNHMRMYWGKKILEWSRTPQQAYAAALALNNRYFLDGRDPASYANVAWLFGMHDRPWPQRPIFGTVRSMTASGLKRKCDIEAYVAKVNRLTASLTTHPAGTSRS